MKRFSLLCLSILLLIPITVKAASAPNIKTLEASTLENTVKYNGTVDDGSYAVMCKLFNEDNEEISLLSSAVENGTFNGTFTGVSKGTYNVACANYEGGEFKKAEVIVNYTNTSNESKENPKTGERRLYHPHKARIICRVSRG